MDKLLEIIEKNPRLSNSEIAVMLGKSEEETEELQRLKKIPQLKCFSL